MKYLMLIVSLSLSSLAFAQSDLKVRPIFPASCDLVERQDHRFLNQMFPIERAQEDDQFVSFRFLSSFFACDDGNVIPKAFEKDGELKLAIINRGLFAGSAKGIVTKTLTVISEGLVQVDLTFDKNKALKGRDKASAGSQLSKAWDAYFYPGDKEKYLSMNGMQMVETKVEVRFPWRMLLTETIGGGSTLQQIQ